MSAGLAFQPDIRAKAHHLPLVAATRMRFTQTEDIVHLKIGEHGQIISHVIICPTADDYIRVCLKEVKMLGLDPSVLIPRAITLILALTVHEFAHAWVATAYGDETPRAAGRLSLNPLRHLDIMGSLMLLLVGFGWAKPVPVDPYALERKSPSALMWVSLAGPFSNFLLAVLAAIPLRAGLVSMTYESLYGGLSLAGFLLEFILINLTLMLFNLLPVAPLDGEKIASYVLPPSAGRFLDQIRQFGPIILILLLFVLPMLKIDVFSAVIYPVLYRLTGLLIGSGG